MSLLPGVNPDAPVFPDVPGIWGDYEIEEVVEFQARPAGGSYVYVNMRSLRTGELFENVLYNTESVYFPICEMCGGIATDCEGLCQQDDYCYDPDADPYAYGSGWYDYDAGLRWSDFVEGPIGD